MDTATANWLLDRIPPQVVDTMTPDQIEAITDAAGQAPWDDHAVNIRLTLPLILRRFYVTVIGGNEKRGDDRRGIDRHKYPLRTVANGFFFIGMATLFYTVLLIIMALYSVLIEF